MSRKCCCCDTAEDLTYNNEEFYCYMCFYQTYFRFDFENGYDSASEDIKSYDLHDIEDAIASFEFDPPSNARHWGYLKCLLDSQNSFESRKRTQMNWASDED